MRLTHVKAGPPGGAPPYTGNSSPDVSLAETVAGMSVFITVAHAGDGVTGAGITAPVSEYLPAGIAHKAAPKQASSRHRVCQAVCQINSYYRKFFKYSGLQIRLEARLGHINQPVTQFHPCSFGAVTAA